LRFPRIGLSQRLAPLWWWEAEHSRQGWDDGIIVRLLIELEARMVVVMMVMVAGMDDHHNLRLRRVR